MTNTLCDQISTQMHACACGCIVLAGYIEFGILDSNILDIIAHVLESGCMCWSTGWTSYFEFAKHKSIRSSSQRQRVDMSEHIGYIGYIGPARLYIHRVHMQMCGYMSGHIGYVGYIGGVIYMRPLPRATRRPSFCLISNYKFGFRKIGLNGWTRSSHTSTHNIAIFTILEHLLKGGHIAPLHHANQINE